MPNHVSTPTEDGETIQRFLNRDISWMEFNRRVLAQAEDTDAPLLERAKFLAIYANNLDEFFMKRFGLLKLCIEEGKQVFSADGRAPDAVINDLRRMVIEDADRLARCWEDDIRPKLADAGIRVTPYSELDRDQRRSIDTWFNSEVFPVLTPLAVDPGHPFPFISNLSENLGILLRRPGTTETEFARLKVPDIVDRFVEAPIPTGMPPETKVFVPLDEIIFNNLDDLFPGMEIVDVMAFRVTRSAVVESDLDDEADDLLEHVESQIRRRRFADPIRLEVLRAPSAAIMDLVTSELGISDSEIYIRDGLLEYTDLFQLAKLDRPDLRDEPWKPITPPRLSDDDQDVFSVIRAGDVLVHHPYESFAGSTERFIAEASRDPDVLAIKLTLYRTSGGSPFVASLIRAAERGKQVACLVELRARFDEQKNVRFARRLERAGVHVAYGIMGLKTHSKCSLVVRRESINGKPGVRCYAHLGTGNYHPDTAQLYTDFGLLTCDPAITHDVIQVFNVLTGRANPPVYNQLLVAPTHMRSRFAELIRNEIANARAGRPAGIIAKMNSFEDKRITNLLYTASQAGVPITLYVRGFCTLRPGVEGLSENIRVVSVVGRFLEHSRVFWFRAAADDPGNGEFYIASADWMYRNLNNRLEVATPVLDPAAKAELWDLLETHRRDQVRAWELRSDGTYTPPATRASADPKSSSPEDAGTFRSLMARARDKARAQSALTVRR